MTARDAMVGAVIAVALHGCAPPCAADAECGQGSYCSAAGACARDCEAADDCGPALVCSGEGRCEEDPRPAISWVSPAEGDLVGPTFDVVVEVSFRGPDATVVLTRDPTAPGQACAPFLAAEAAIPGDPQARTTTTVTFPAVRATGDSFGVAVEARAGGGIFTTARALRGDVPVYGGMDIAPTGAPIDADLAVGAPLSATLDQPALAVTTWVEAGDGRTTPRTVVGTATDAVAAWLPLLRGPQVAWVEAQRADGFDRCAVASTTTATAAPADIEVGLSFEGVEVSALDLWVFDADTACSATTLAGACTPAWRSPRPARTGGEILRLVDAPGLYGIAVAPGAAGPPVRAWVRVSRGDRHIALLGPLSIDPSHGEVWLAGRVFVSPGEAQVEELTAVIQGLPADPPAEW